MQLLERIYMVGSGEIGLSDPNDCHIYLVDGGDEYALIDCGTGTDESIGRIEQNMRHHGLDPKKLGTIILTHWHFDHASGAQVLRDRWGCRVLIPGIEQTFMEQGRAGIPPCRIDDGLSHGDRVQVGQVELIAHVVPGHSEGTTAFQLDTTEGRALFASDVAFVNGIIGLINYPGSDLTVYREHIDRLRGLNVDALLPGHMLFTLGNGQRHLDLAVDRLTSEQFVPYNVGQMGISFIPAAKF